MSDAIRPQVFRRGEMNLIPANTPTGTTSIARVINSSNSRNMGGGLECLENVTIDWTVTYDEILFIHDGDLTIEIDGTPHHCAPGDIVFLPTGTHLRYIANGRATYFYALTPVDWAERQGIKEP